MRGLLMNILKNLQFEDTYIAINAEAGLNMYKDYEPHIALIDNDLGDMSGVELTRQIRQYEKAGKFITPVMLMATSVTKKDVIETLDAGVSELLLKPFSLNDLSKRLHYIFEKPRELIDVKDYYGPDRRRRVDFSYTGPKRRKGER